MKTIGNELRQQRFNRKANIVAFVVMVILFSGAFVNWAINLA